MGCVKVGRDKFDGAMRCDKVGRYKFDAKMRCVNVGRDKFDGTMRCVKVGRDKFDDMQSSEWNWEYTILTERNSVLKSQIYSGWSESLPSPSRHTDGFRLL